MNIFDNKYIYIKIISVNLILIFLLGCAAQGPPSGGPKDTTGPKLLSTQPERGTLNFPVDGRVVFEFSENIAPRSAENALIIRPILQNKPRVKVRRNKAIVTFPDNLRDNTTYIISFGRNIKDYRENAVNNNVQLAFSTGDNLSKAMFSGIVNNVKKDNFCKIMAWESKKFNPDSLPHINPGYITTADSSGSFKLTNLAAGSYYLLAASSKQNIKQINAQNRIAIANRMPLKIDTDTTEIGNINFNMTEYDLLTRFKLKTVKFEEPYITCTFSHPVSQELWDSLNISISSADTILKKWRDDSKESVAHILTDSLPSDTTSLLTIQNLYNQRNEKILPEYGQGQFVYKSGVDTIRPHLQTARPANNSKKVPNKTTIDLNFTEPLDNIDPDADIELISGKDSSRVELSFATIDDNTLKISPDSGLENHTDYIVNCYSYKWRDHAGNRFRDSTFSITFQTWDPREFGYMSGVVKLGEQPGFEHILLQAQKIDSDYQVKTTVDSVGSFRFDQLFPGEYKLALWQDSNHNRKYDPGSLYPITPAEYYKSFTDKVKIRARWETADVRLK
ncbi:MAG: Ig-like domain-containing protein [Candidatus Marinimicrobia bacterium]|nr:Ig-like domain-containing protein [Candidatus Neomarinimicrobiota bacterium]